jgi:hypothetical protein
MRLALLIVSVLGTGWYEHWMEQGPAPVPYCRNAEGQVRICAMHMYLSGDQPYVHETYLQPGRSVKFEAVPSRDEQVGVKFWTDGKEQYLWCHKSG